MQTDNKLLDDLARVAAGAFGTIFGMKDEVEAQLRQQFERVLSRMDVVTREEFEAVREMAAKARSEQEAMAARLEALEQRLGPAREASEEPADPSQPAPAAGRRSRKRGKAEDIE